jgi:DNA-binding response OmpR family regulator
MAPPILLVDDDLALAQAMTMSIENVGIPVEHCATGEVAIDLIRQKRYAVIVVDVMLPAGISGLYVVNAIRHLPVAQRPPVLMITGASLENLRGVDKTVVTAVLLKPLDFALFADFVLATYRRSQNLTSETGLPAAALQMRTFCGNCGEELIPWIADRSLPETIANDVFDIWMDTPCPGCGTAPRLSGGRSEWTDAS